MASAALRVAFGLIWVIDAALTWTPKFATHYVGYLHNAAQSQAAWSAWWFNMWIAVVTPHAGLFMALFDKVHPDGTPAHALNGVSTYSLGPGEGAVRDANPVKLISVVLHGLPAWGRNRRHELRHGDAIICRHLE